MSEATQQNKVAGVPVEVYESAQFERVDRFGLVRYSGTTSDGELVTIAWVQRYTWIDSGRVARYGVKFRGALSALDLWGFNVGEFKTPRAALAAAREYVRSCAFVELMCIKTGAARGGTRDALIGIAGKLHK